MAITVGGAQRGTMVELNVVPLIDILLVLLVIFMIIPHHQTGLKAEIPQKAAAHSPAPEPEVVVVQVLADGSLSINQQSVEWDALRDRLDEIFKVRANRTAFVRGDAAVEFQWVARVIDVMRGVDVSSVGLMTPQLEGGH